MDYRTKSYPIDMIFVNVFYCYFKSFITQAVHGILYPCLIHYIEITGIYKKLGLANFNIIVSVIIPAASILYNSLTLRSKLFVKFIQNIMLQNLIGW